MTARIERATVDDWHRLEAIGRRALATDPSAFCASAHTGHDTEVRWRDRLAGRGLFLAVDEQGRDIGMVGLRTGAHAELVSMWVAPDARGRHVGAALVAAVVAAAGDEELRLRVMADNASAIGFYARQGFVLVPGEPDEEGTVTMTRAASPGPSVWPRPATRPHRAGGRRPGGSADQ